MAFSVTLRLSVFLRRLFMALTGLRAQRLCRSSSGLNMEANLLDCISRDPVSDQAAAITYQPISQRSAAPLGGARNASSCGHIDLGRL